VIAVEEPVTEAFFERLFTDHHEAVRRYCRRRLDGHAAEDAAADVFVVAWRRIADVPQGEAAVLWLYGVARNVVARAQRGDRRRGRLAAKALSLGVATGEPPETVVIRSEDERKLLEALWRLRPDDQEVLRLKAWEELSHAEIGTVLGISTSAVDARASRAIKRLARSYGGDA